MREASGGGTIFLGAASASCRPLTRMLVCPDVWLPNVSDLMATASATVPPPRDWKTMATGRNDPKRSAHLQGAPRASRNQGVTRTDPAENRPAPIADRERRPLQVPALRTPTPSGTS